MGKRTLYGYRIGCDIYVDIRHKCLVYMVSDKNKEASGIKVVHLRKTMMQLLIYILDNAQQHIIQDDDIMLNVWDAQGLSSSRQRLWQVINTLSQKLCAFGISAHFIKRVRAQGYIIDKEIIILIYGEKM
ncbi:winged helix-turn-helix domain-containing protein [Serratia fonticola]|uniref:winged helix-turn-helix domain-containing protein n=1 Tax=Serratia fonticola TaxID=47917 RepID=UPI0024DE2023|nr:winged helix-turn-helix domain-containing protein [Serratia fonticola]MDK2374339.1 winged helix-turn-helix domain-containing protein [Serratia fonticola]